ncbi:MAG: ATP-dependent DNA helicase [Lachnospiraceae bacterium]|nr:ATP-dependent DNA helicase [Lachnospiraceae bacterium]
MEIRNSVRSLVEFILRAGDIDNRRKSSPEDAMSEGSRIHRMIQRRMGSEYHAEVTMRYRCEYADYSLLIEGRADGVIDGKPVTIDEIKGTYRDLAKMKAPDPVHLSQAKCYAWIYAHDYGCTEMKVRMTYCNLDTEEIRYFESQYTMAELTDWFMNVLRQYKKWSDQEIAWKEKRQTSIRNTSFPFSYREGQKELITHVYHTIFHKKKLFMEAPTGVGKTISTVFPAVKAIGEGKADRIFYLTAKTITRTVADNCFSLLRNCGLKFRTVTLTARDKICFMEESECNPDYCPYAKGHYDRINDAIFDMLMSEENFGREKIEEYAQKHRVCPFEMALDMSLFSDGIICDYNYVFDPHVYLRRFFGDGNQKGKSVFLVDEAHNLLERGREMYSAVLYKEDFLALKRTIRAYDTRMEKLLEKCNRELLNLKRECEDWCIVEQIDPFVQSLMRLSSGMEDYLENHDDSPVRREVLDFYFEVSHFLMIYELMDRKYVMYTQFDEEGRFFLKLFNVDPSGNLKECLDRGVSSILFSATLLPIQYYKKLLGGDETDYEVYARSTFDPARKALFLAQDVTSRYTRRSDMEYYNIASYIHQIVSMRYGNYMVFFPSHVFLQHVLEIYQDYFAETDHAECLVQEDYMSEEDREAFIRRFEGNDRCDLSDIIQMEIEIEEESSLVGFCVLGGIFSEGIDLKEESLIGAMIVGTGLPQVCTEREILKQYFSEDGENGFDYAYRYPGMNKVLQAAGRVIRTADDIGVVALLDERFLQRSYQRLFPREWESFEVVNSRTVAGRVEKFWNDWL